jgi:hypothetical protein
MVTDSGTLSATIWLAAAGHRPLLAAGEIPISVWTDHSTRHGSMEHTEPGDRWGGCGRGFMF